MVFAAVFEGSALADGLEEEFLGVRPDLRAVTSNDQCLNLLPVLAVELQS